MNNFFRFAIILLCIPILTPCAGSAYKLLPVNEADVSTMQLKMAVNKQPLVIYERSDKKNPQLVSSVTSHLTKNAKPLCEYSIRMHGI